MSTPGERLPTELTYLAPRNSFQLLEVFQGFSFPRRTQKFPFATSRRTFFSKVEIPHQTVETSILDLDLFEIIPSTSRHCTAVKSGGTSVHLPLANDRSDRPFGRPPRSFPLPAMSSVILIAVPFSFRHFRFRL